MDYKSHPKMKYLYVGIDCHKEVHTASIINCFNEQLDTITFNNDKKGYESLIRKVDKHKENLLVAFGLEDVKHLGYGLASFLIKRNYLVKHVNSNLTSNERKKSPIMSKNDEIDSHCIAKVLLDEFDNLPNAKSDEIFWTLKQMIKLRNVMIKNIVEIKNKLHAQLLHHYPNYKQFFYDSFGATATIFWEKYPSPDLLLKEDKQLLIDLLFTTSRGHIGTKKVEEILKMVNEYDVSNQVYQNERNNIILFLLKQLKSNNKRLAEIDKEVIAIYDKTEVKLHTYPCLDKITSACILSEIGNINRFNNSSKLAKYAGIAPVEFSSGGKDVAICNRYGNRVLNSYIYKLACRSISTGCTKETPFNAIFLEFYNKKISEGKTKHQAIVCIMRRTISIIYSMLNNNQEYIPPEQLIEQSKISFKERKAKLELEEKLKLEKKERHKKKVTN